MKRLLLVFCSSLFAAGIVVLFVILKYGSIKEQYDILKYDQNESDVLTYVLNPSRKQVEIISQFYKNLFLCENKDSVVKSNCSSKLQDYLATEYSELIESWGDGWRESPNWPKVGYAKWKFYTDHIEWEYADKVIDITPLNHEWYQVYVCEACDNINGEAIVYMRLVNENGGFKIDELKYSLPQFETRIDDFTFMEKCLFRYVCMKGKYEARMDSFKSGLIWVNKEGKVGCINQYGKEIIPCKYSSVENYNSEKCFYKISQNGKYGLIDIVGNTILRCIYDEIGDWKDYRAKVRLNGKYGFINPDYATPTVLYDKAEDFKKFGYDNYGNERIFAKVQKNGKYGYINKWCQEVLPCKYDEIEDFRKHGDYVLAEVTINYKSGFIDQYFDEVVPCEYFIVGDFRNGLCSVCSADEDRKWGYVDRYGREVIPCVLDYAGDFDEDGIAHVEYRGAAGKLDKYGQFTESWESAHRDDAPLPMTRCTTCGGTGRIAIGGGGLVLDYQTCPACMGTGQIVDIQRTFGGR